MRWKGMPAFSDEKTMGKCYSLPMEKENRENLYSYVRDLPEPEDYLDGVSSEIRYEPYKILLFSRYSTSQYIEKDPIVHYRFNLIVALEGSMDIHMDNEIVTMGKGESLLIFPFQHHYYLTASDKEMLWCYIGFDLHQRAGLERLKYRTMRTDSFELDCLDRLLRAGKDLKGSILSSMLHSMSERSEEYQFQKNSKAEKDGSHIVSRVQEIVYRDMNIPLTMKDISEELGVSESSLHKQFQALLGISPGRYIREAKINFACSILEAGKLNISETADQCGYDSLFSFSRAFKNITGLSPRDFRKERTLHSGNSRFPLNR